MDIDDGMRVADAMSHEVLTIGPSHTLLQAAQAMASRNVGAAVVHDTEGDGAGILTERDILRSVAAGEDQRVETAGAHLTQDIVYAMPTWTLTEAAQAMLRGGFRHLVVLDGGEVTGMLSVRDVVQAWAGAPST